MIPSVLASQVEKGIENFLRTTFPPSNSFFHGILDRLFAERDHLFKGPYVSMKLPFLQGNLGVDHFDSFDMNFIPFLHQEKAFNRLSLPDPKSTIISTGTGSGKTEAFLFPIIDYCYQHRGESGIKAIIIYPMNALANDQAKRIARFIQGDSNLKGNVTAGLFVGQEPQDMGQMAMGSEMVITHKETMRTSPPDILLTNYKMLDYLLIRPNDYPLWKNNHPETLKFLVVDELHTFDGAQGSDLACLVRRLKARVKAPKKYVCCIGTSATLGGGQSGQELHEYASQIFGEPFDDQSVITEERLKPNQFLGPANKTSAKLPSEHQKDILSPDSYDTWLDYIKAQHNLWFPASNVDFNDDAWTVALVEELKQHTFFRQIVRVLDNQTLSVLEIARQLQNTDAQLQGYLENTLVLFLDSMLALVSTARTPRLAQQGKLPPFLDVRIQLWMRELRRVVSALEVDPSIKFSDDLKPDQLQSHLPLVHCRECGAMGWSALKKQHANDFETDLQAFYQGYFNYSPRIHFIFPDKKSKEQQQKFGQFICGHCLHMGYGEIPATCPACSNADKLLAVNIENKRTKRKNKVYGTHNCPYCESTDALTIVGSRSASLLSVVIGQLSSSTYYNDPDRKLITFSDSVQDASHRAGFFASRTYAFNFRTALQKVVMNLKRPISLNDLAAEFSKYWIQSLKEPDYVANFLAPNMAWLEEYEAFLESGTLSPGSSLLQDVENRIKWEILSEYGFRARIGRTLERTSCSIATVDDERLAEIMPSLLERLTNEVGGWQNLTIEELKRSIIGLLTQIRTRGGVDDPLLQSYIKSWGISYLLTRLPFMPDFGQHSRAPIFLTTKHGTRFDVLIGSDTNESWFQNWLLRSLGSYHVKITDYSKEILELLVRVLVETKILTEFVGLSHPVWGINPKALVILNEVDQYRCDHCGYSASAAKLERPIWEGMACRRFRCAGHYERQPTVDDYYGKLYSTGELHRIFAGEHTGLLDRYKRTELENRFIQREKATDENLLSCTPTMEMGINIGDLSTVLLCSIPPSQSNYLQRIGRSGREDGNAFNFAMAEGKPHDLYFFEEPTEMLAGLVETPGIFLNAPAVLERQFVGFCFDRWIETGISANVLPRKMNQVLGNMKLGAKSAAFPFNWLTFIELNRTSLQINFQDLFAGTLTADSEERLKIFVEGDKLQQGSLVYKVLDRLNGLESERKNLRDRIIKINKTIKAKKASKTKDQNTEQELDDLERDKTSINSIIRTINQKDTFHFFTDEGLLPNYAFPEAGILLRSIIYRKKKTPDKAGKYSTKVYEYQRPAVTAIHELAPANTFYADGRKVTIDTVNLGLSEPVEWRFCDACDHTAIEATNKHSATCPKCGSKLWGDHAQKRRMLKLRQVEATTSDKASRVDDAHDSREPQLYNKHMLAEIDPQYIEKAYKIDSDDLPFGFEFIRKADFREINFGIKGLEHGVIEIAGKKVSDTGFILCRDCGKVQHNNDEIEHSLTCKYYNKPNEDPLLDYLYLYREFTSEAIRMLLPLASLGVPLKLHSFLAAIYLGLKLTYKGSIDHIEAAIIEEPIPDDSIRKQYLVLYDRVPGGTGYLKELTSSKDKMMELMDAALQALKQCSCHNDPDKDGCYRCIYAYRVSRDMMEISRTEAIDLLSSILAHRKSIVKIESVSKISINSLYESELEARFIEALESSKPGGKPVLLTKDVVNGKPGWRLKLEKSVYLIEPQVDLGQDQGIGIPSRADFVFYPEKQDDGLPIAIFTDGFHFHADISSNHLRIGKDLAQRMALVKSGNYLVWSLSWNDVESQFKKNSSDFFDNYLDHSVPKLLKLLDAYDDDFGTKACKGYEQKSAFESFLDFLNQPDTKRWALYAFLQAINGPGGCVAYTDEQWPIDHFSSIEEPLGWDQYQLPVLKNDPQGDWFNNALIKEDEIGRSTMCMLVSMPKDVARDPKRRDEIALTARLFDDADIAATKEFKSSWNGFIRLYNFIQFLPQSKFVTTQGLMAGDFQDIPTYKPKSSGGTMPPTESELKELFQFTDPSVHGIIKEMAASNVSLPEPGYEIAGSKGQVLATGELAWPEEKFAILLPLERSAKTILEEQGWLVFEIADFPDAMESLVANLSNRSTG